MALKEVCIESVSVSGEWIPGPVSATTGKIIYLQPLSPAFEAAKGMTWQGAKDFAHKVGARLPDVKEYQAIIRFTKDIYEKENKWILPSGEFWSSQKVPGPDCAPGVVTQAHIFCLGTDDDLKSNYGRVQRQITGYKTNHVASAYCVRDMPEPVEM